MQSIHIGKNIAALRKGANMTQEDLAKVLLATNQSVSKWESGVCFPDIQLLPQIATHFNITIDALLGAAQPSQAGVTFDETCAMIRRLFKEMPGEISFSLAYKLASLLHEGACSQGYRRRLPWDADTPRKMEQAYENWIFSACSEPEGVTFHKRNAVLISDGSQEKNTTPSEVRDIHNALLPLRDACTLQVLFTLYDMTKSDEDAYLSVEQLAEAAKTTVAATRSALEDISLEEKALESDETGYRLAGCAMHIPVVLRLLTEK